MELLGDVHHVEPHLVRLEIVLVLVQHNYPVYAKCTIGLEIVLDAHNDLLGDVSYVESSFDPFGYYVNVGQFIDSANLNAR
jgi:hypothetical protein